MSLIRQLAIAYALMFFAVAAIGCVPVLDDAGGSRFGQFGLQGNDDLLHAFSGLWALAAALLSDRQSVLCLQMLGSVYLLDGVLGVVSGSGCLDAGILIAGLRAFDDIDLPARFVANATHLAVGGLALLIGFRLTNRSSGRLAMA